MAGVNGYVSINLIDNGGSSIVVPGQSTQLVIGTSSAGTVNQLVASRNPTTIGTTFGFGPLPEAGALMTLGGGTGIFIRATSATAGASTAVVFTGSGSSVMTITGTPNDTYYLKVTAVTGGTVGVAGITITVSLDAGRTTSAPVAITAATPGVFAIPGTGLTLSFAAGTVVAGDVNKASTTEPLFNTAGILLALQAYAASPYAQQPVGSIHFVGGSLIGGVPGADATTIGGFLEGSQVGATSLGNPLYNAGIMTARDSKAPTTYGGLGETEGTWMTAIETDYANVAQKRLRVCAGYWNMPSALVNPMGIIPRFRRPLAWAIAQRKVQIQAQRSVGRVKDGPLASIVIDAINDPLDGFIYHNDSNFAPAGLGDFRFITSTTRSFLQSIYARTDLTMAVTGSQYNQGPLIDVANFASVIIQQTTQEIINDNVRLLPAGTLDPRDASDIQAAVGGQITALMLSQQMISSFTVVVDVTNNVQLTGVINIVTTLVSRGVVLQVNNTLQYNNPFGAQAA